MEALTASQKMKTAKDFLPINGTDHIELYVGNAKQAAYYYKTAFGFQSLAYAGPETGVRDMVSYVLQQGKIRLVLTTPLKSDSDISEHIRKHGDGVKILALWVDDAYKAYEETTKRGGKHRYFRIARQAASSCCSRPRCACARRFTKAA